jgi:DHA2 family lincomycin resistance protein-like MFS transporter
MSSIEVAGAAAVIERRNRLVINLLLVSAFVVILNETLMGVAIPPLMESLGVTAAAAQWVTSAFLLTMAIVIPLTGFMLQRLPTRTIFNLAMSLFTLGTLAAALAPGLELLVAARVIQASGTAIMMPLLMTTVMNLVPPETRGKTMGNITLVISVAPAIGPVVSGLILNYLHWRWLFLLMLPISIGALWLGWRRIENVTTPRDAPLDLASVVLSVFAFGGIVYGLSLLGVPRAPGQPPAWAPLAVGAAAMVAFIARQRSLERTNSALLDLRVFASRNFTFALLLFAILTLVLFGTIIVLPIYLQNVLGISTLTTGLLLLPGGLLMGRLGQRAGRWYDHMGPAKLVIPGVVIVAAVLWAMTLLGTGTRLEYILAGHIVLCVGFALLFTPLFTVSLSSVRPELYSHGSAVLGSLQQVTGAAGVALFVAIMSARTAQLAAAGTAQLEALAAGARAAFLCGAIFSLAAVACALFVRKPPTPAPSTAH